MNAIVTLPLYLTAFHVGFLLLFLFNEYILDSDVYSLNLYGSHIHAIDSLFFYVEYICKIMND